LLFGRLFPDVTEHVFTYNAPGISFIGEAALRHLGVGPIDATRVTNVASVMGSEPISRIWSKPGENIGVFTEAGSALYQHSIVPLTDTLALYGTFATLSPGLASDPAAVSGIISAASPYSESSLELTLDALATTLGVDGAPTLIASTISDLAARDSYYHNLYALLDGRSPGRNYAIESLAGKSAGELAAMADDHVSVRFALKELTPFAADGADFASFDDSFSGGWLASRAEWLAAMLEGNQVDRVFGFSGTADNVIFRDLDAERSYSLLDGTQGILATQVATLADRSRIRDFLENVAYNRSVVFGSESAGDRLVGLSGGDRLFGAAGDDSLEGAAGDDYLEGGAGSDTLIGGAGDDVLSGGDGADRLEGGAGSDTYLFSGALGADTIVDRDGLVYAGNVLLTGGNREEGEAFLSSDGQYSYEFRGDLESEGTLVINGALRVEGFRNGDLGIRLVDGFEPAEWRPITDALLLGDISHDWEDFDEYGNILPDIPSNPAPGRQDLDHELPGTPGNTRFSMGGGNDRTQDRLGGDDWIELGSGDDAGFGGSGDDLIEGGPGRDVVAGGRGNDVLYAGSIETFEADLDDQASGTRIDGGDLLSGGDGDDTIFGDAEANLIEGGAGLDQIFAGAGDDWIGSDVSELARREVYEYIDFNFGSPRNIDFLWRGGPPPNFSLRPSSVFGQPGTAAIGLATLNPKFLDPAVGDADEIDAGSGNDIVAAGGGNDVIFGGSGNDYIDTGAGIDTVYGEGGRDYINASWDALGDYVDGGAGDDVVQGGAGDDTLIGGPGNDQLNSSEGDDVLIGGAGDDILTAHGNSILDGGPGDDTFGGGAQPGETIRVLMGRGSGNDSGIITSGGKLAIEILGDVSPQEVSLARVEKVIPARDGGGPAFETITGLKISIGANGGSLYLEDLPPELAQYYQQPPRQIEFSDGTVWDEGYIQSVISPDAVEEGPPPVTAGSAAADLLYGTAGADMLSGDAGDDWLVGGAGSDTYLHGSGDGFDVIEDVDASPGNVDALRFGDGIEAEDVEVFATGNDYMLIAGDGGVRIRGGRTQAGAIERVDFADASSWTAADLEARAQVLPENRPPEMPASLGRIAVDPGAPVEVVIPANAISDPDQFDSLSYYAIAADGERLPEWLAFNAASLRFSGTPGASDAGSLEILLIAADSSGAASAGRLTIAVGGAEPAPGSAAPVPASAPAPGDLASESPVSLPESTPATVPAAAREETTYAADYVAAPLPEAEPPRVGVPTDPFFRDMQRRFDVLLQTGRTNLGERYAEAIRDFEERRMQREEAPPPPPPTDEEIGAWNSAMHSWLDRNPGFAETDLGGGDGAWGVGWGLPGPEDRSRDGTASAGGVVGLGNPGVLSRLTGADAAPALSEGLRSLR